jgi:hypothetical protein
MNDEPRAWLLENPNETLFTHGACHIFAAKLQELFGYSLKACRDKNNEIIHCYAIRDGEGINAKGSIARKYFHEAFTFERAEDIDSSALLDYFRKLFPREESEEISDGKSFNQIASERAEPFISANRNRFAPPISFSIASDRNGNCLHGTRR